ncbi:MAG TPA: hypothetical protein VGV86_12540 [Acidimicrobiales bacterium]|nr:hypothetical protein [Acidimicrobiales bacterium]
MLLHTSPEDVTSRRLGSPVGVERHGAPGRERVGDEELRRVFAGLDPHSGDQLGALHQSALRPG